MTLPMQGMKPLEMVISTTYLLKEVVDDKAYFDLKQSLKMGTSQEELKMSAEGAGTGSCVYSIRDNYMISYDSRLPITMSIMMNEMMQMNMQMDTDTAMRVTID